MEFFSKILGRVDENNTLDSDNKQSFKKHPILENEDSILKVPVEDAENSLNVSGLARELDAKLILGTPKQEPSNKFKINKWADASPNTDFLFTSDSFSPNSVASSDLSFVTAQDSFTSIGCTSPTSPISEAETLSVDETINVSSGSADTLNLTLDESIIPKVESETNFVSDLKKVAVDDFEIIDIDCDKNDSKLHDKQKSVENDAYINSSVISQDITYLSAEESASEEGTSCYTSLENIYTTVIHNSQVDNSNYDVSVVGLNDVTQIVDHSIRNFSTITFPDQSCVDQYIEEISVVEPNNTAVSIEDAVASNNIKENTQADTSTEGVDKEILNLSTHTIIDTHEINSTTSLKSEKVDDFYPQDTHDKKTKSLETPTVEKKQIEEEIIDHLSKLNLKSHIQSESLVSTEVTTDVTGDSLSNVGLYCCAKVEPPELSFEEVRASTYKTNAEVVTKNNLEELVTSPQENRSEEGSEKVPPATVAFKLVTREIVGTSIEDCQASEKAETKQRGEFFPEAFEVVNECLVIQGKEPERKTSPTIVPSEVFDQDSVDTLELDSKESVNAAADNHIPIEIVKNHEELKKLEENREESAVPQVVVQDIVGSLRKGSQEPQEQKKKSEESYTATPEVNKEVLDEIIKKDRLKLKEQEKNCEVSDTTSLEVDNQVPIEIVKEEEKKGEVPVTTTPEANILEPVEIIKEDIQELGEQEKKSEELITAAPEVDKEVLDEIIKEDSLKIKEQEKSYKVSGTASLEGDNRVPIEIAKEEEKNGVPVTTTPQVIILEPVEIIKEDIQELGEQEKKSEESITAAPEVDKKVPDEIIGRNDLKLKEEEKNYKESGTASLEADNQVPIEIVKEKKGKVLVTTTPEVIILESVETIKEDIQELGEQEKKSEELIDSAPEVDKEVLYEIIKEDKQLENCEKSGTVSLELDNQVPIEIVKEEEKKSEVPVTTTPEVIILEPVEIIKEYIQELGEQEKKSEESITAAPEVDNKVPLEIIKNSQQLEEQEKNNEEYSSVTLESRNRDQIGILKEDIEEQEEKSKASVTKAPEIKHQVPISILISTKLEGIEKISDESVTTSSKVLIQDNVEISTEDSEEVKEQEKKSEELVSNVPEVDNQDPIEIQKGEGEELGKPKEKTEKIVCETPNIVIPGSVESLKEDIQEFKQREKNSKASITESDQVSVEVVKEDIPDHDLLNESIKNLSAEKIYETDSSLANKTEDSTVIVEPQISNINQQKKPLPKESKNQHNDSLGEFEFIEAQLSSDQAKEEKYSSERSKELSGESETELLDKIHEENLMDDENLNKSEAGPNTADFSTEEFHSGDEDFLDLLAQKPSLSESELRKQSLFVQFDPILKKSPVRLVRQKSVTPPIQKIMEEETVNDSKLSKVSDLNESVNNLSLNNDDPINGECASSTPNPEEAMKQKAPISATLVTTSNTEKDKLIEKLKKENAVYQKMLNDYENTITQCVNQRESDKKQFEKYKKELDKEKEEVQTHLRNSEIAFNDVHLKYERSKAIIEGLKANEDQLRASYTALEEELKKQVNKYDALKTHAISQLEKGNQELDLKIKTNEMETAKLRAMLKKAEMLNASLQESLTRKTQENAELTSICDDLISKVGQNV